MRVLVPSPVRSYTQGLEEVEGVGATVAEVLAELDARFPGLAFRLVDEQGRIRPHIKFFVGETLARTTAEPLPAGVTLQIVCALSGG